MPGLVGIISRMPKQKALLQLDEMVRSMEHESFYTSGRWSDPALGAYVGWVQREGSFAARMPLVNEKGDVVLIFSGEDVPEPGIRDTLRRSGHSVETEGSDYLVHLYEEDPEFPANLNGLFHGLVIDRRTGKVVLFNDRFGLHRLYYCETPDAFYFSAEAKALLAVCPATRTFDLRGLGEFISLGCVLENRSLFPGINVLPPASAWRVGEGAVQARTAYFDPREWEEQEPLDEEGYYQAVREIVERRMPSYLSGPERVGLALTGGLDTRVIMAWGQSAPGSLPCYTFGGALRESRDVKIAREVASLCEQPYRVISVGDDFLAQFTHYAERTAFLSDGTVSVANAADLYVSERARQIAPVKAVGTWGSELMRQAVTFKPTAPEPGLFDPEVMDHIAQSEQRYTHLRQIHPVTFAAFRQTPWAQYGVEALEQTQLGLRTPFLDNELVRTIYRAPNVRAADIRAKLIQAGNRGIARIHSDRGAAPNDSGLRATATKAWHEFTFKCEYALDMGMPQWLVPFSPFLQASQVDRLFLGRHKFQHFRAWYSGPLSSQLKQILLDSNTSLPLLEPRRKAEIVEAHLRGTRNYTSTLHCLLTLELIQRQLVRRSYAASHALS